MQKEVVSPLRGDDMQTLDARQSLPSNVLIGGGHDNQKGLSPTRNLPGMF